MKAKKALLTGCAGLLVLAVLVVGFVVWSMSADHSVYVTGAASHELAPASARSIDYFESRDFSGVVSVSYTIDEAEFRKFAAEQGWDLSENGEVRGDVRSLLPSDWAAKDTTKSRKFGPCLWYEVIHKNSGGITVIYLPAESRAIINKSHN
ncbi:hypothetical protein [Haloferula sp. BvORR071]|uniref:hypothetical protein n=1 Tax=Haloferula sp. BvORR071 TaxID=1396141 RepID=UPI0005503C09|nr:hypothetical protein [Haloferula sp. BvORR071]